MALTDELEAAHQQEEAPAIHDEDDVDSAVGSDQSTYTETLRSSLLQSVRENGRSYHKYHDGAYILPEDEQEQDRLDMQHEIYLRTLGRKLLLAPVRDHLGDIRKSIPSRLERHVMSGLVQSCC